MKLVFLVALALFASLSGCAKDRSLAPPPDSEQVVVQVKVPEQLQAETMQVMYRSTVCTFTDHSAYGKPYSRDGYQRMDMQPIRQGGGDIYEAKLPLNGGGACHWRLSNVTFGVSYAEPTRFGDSVPYGTGGGVVVMFDHNNSPQGGADIQVEGDVIVKKNYYPWLHQRFVEGYDTKYLSIAGDGAPYLMYRALQARQVYFEPILHSDFLVSSIEPKVHKVGSFIKFTYPDGSSASDGRAKPDFRKLEAIRLNRESKQ
jgi:hypothetical protein